MSALAAAAGLVFDPYVITVVVASAVFGIFVGAIPGLTATMVWFALVGRVGAIRASTFHFLNPFFGVVIAAVLLGERVSLTDIIGVLIAMAGILAVQMARQATR